jgi:hypothetical protein
MKRSLWKLPVLLLFAFVLASGLAAQQAAGNSAPAAKPAVPRADAKVGPCGADFRIVDVDGKPVYGAWIHVLLRYRAFGAGKLDLTVGTDSNGEAEFRGLPDALKKPAQFEISKGTLHATVDFDPGRNCHAYFSVQLK